MNKTETKKIVNTYSKTKYIYDEGIKKFVPSFKYIKDEADESKKDIYVNVSELSSSNMNVLSDMVAELTVPDETDDNGNTTSLYDIDNKEIFIRQSLLAHSVGIDFSKLTDDEMPIEIPKMCFSPLGEIFNPNCELPFVQEFRRQVDAKVEYRLQTLVLNKHNKLETLLTEITNFVTNITKSFDGVDIGETTTVLSNISDTLSSVDKHELVTPIVENIVNKDIE